MTDQVRPRYGGSKTRTGCVTCKARHVKCDEAKPHCNRCIKAGRKCEGYVSSPPKRRSPDHLTFINYGAPNSRSVSPYPQADTNEVRALQYFKACAAPQLAGPFSSDLWLTHMLRLAHHQSPVHHALVALGTVHEEFADPFSERSQFSEYATREYGKAINEVVQMNSARTSESVEIALATCIIFSCLESLRGHYQSSLSHLMSGLNVLEEEQRNPVLRVGQCLPRELLVALFLRMDAQRMDLGGAGTMAAMMLSMLANPSIPTCFSSLDEAWLQLDIIYHQSMHLMYRAEEGTPESHASPPTEFWQGILAQRQVLEELRQSWEDALNKMYGRDLVGEPSSPEQRPTGLILLDLSNKVLKMLLDIDLIASESDFDRYADVFASIVDDADEFLQRKSGSRSSSTSRSPTPQLHQQMASSTIDPPILSHSFSSSTSSSQHGIPLLPKPEPIPPPIFTLSLGCVGPLYLSAARCRNTTIRHRALSLLRKCNRREGLWDSTIAARVAEGVIAIEEQPTIDQLTQKGKLAHYSPQQQHEIIVPDENRVKLVDLKYGPEASGKVMYSFDYPVRPGATQPTVPSALDTRRMGELIEW